MAKTIIIKLTSSSLTSGPFSIKDGSDNIIDSSVTRNELIAGKSYVINDDVNVITLSSLGTCKTIKSFGISTITPSEIASTVYTPSIESCLWRHLEDTTLYNNFYGNICPYVIEYPFSYKYHDEILQNVKDYTKVYKYLSSNNINDKIELDNVWFNKAIIYNGQQSSGYLELVPKPSNNLSAYLSYPIYNEFSKTITFTKRDNFYQYNTFWSLVKDKTNPLFTQTCESLSIDKVINQDNMDYTSRSFKKDTIRAKDVKIRHSLDNRSDVQLVSQFIIVPSMISYL